MKNYKTLELKKNEALMITTPSKVEFPNPKPVKKSVISQFRSYLPLGPQKKVQLFRKIIPIPQELVLLVHGNMMKFYQYSIDFQGKLSVREHSIIEASFNIMKVKIFETGKTLNGKNFFIIAQDESKNYLELYEFQTNINSPVLLKTYRTPSKIHCWSFVSETQILLWAENMNIYHYKLDGLKFSLKSCKKTQITTKGFVVQESQIFGEKDTEQDKLINLVYILYNEKDQKIKIKCKQFVYHMEGEIKVNQQDFEIITMPIKQKSLDNIKLFLRETSILLRFEFEIIIIQKKFQHYYVTDNIYKKDKNCTIRMSNRGLLVSCLFENILQVNEIKLGDIKVSAPMVDFFDFKDFKKQKLINFWLIERDGSTYPIFAMEDGNLNTTLRLANRVAKIKKITNLAKENSLEEVDEFRKLGEVLGVSQTEFYYNMWLSSKQTLSDAENYLIKCNDYEKIINQLHGYMRRKQMPLGKLTHFLKKLEHITLKKLEKDLSEKSLIEFFQSTFLERKFSLYSSEYMMDDEEFKQVLDTCLYSMVQKVINNVLFPKVRKISPWSRVVKDPPVINILQILSSFKLPLLENYQQFLKNIFSHYEDHIPQIIKNFPEILPLHPFNSPVDHALLTESTVMGQKLKTQKQSLFFSDIFQTQVKRQYAFVDNVFHVLFPHYQTSFINKKFENILHHRDIKDKKFIHHMAIFTPLPKYFENISKLAGLKTFIVVCEFLVKTAVKKKKKPRLQETLALFQEYHNLDYESVQKLQLNSLFYELMLKEGIIDYKYDLERVINEPVQKFLGLFFLGNKQKKNLIFNEFLGIHHEREKFQESLRAFVHSEHCSKIELTMLIDLLSKKEKEFQIQNQSIINVIIEGFCSRIQLRDIDDANHFRDRIKTIQLQKQLLIKVDKIDKIKVCLRIFDAFYMQNLTFQVLLTNTLKIIEDMTQKFFNGELRSTHVTIEKKGKPKVNHIFDDCRGLFQLFNYLRQNIFFNLPASDLVITFSKKLIQWQQFEELNYFFYESNWLNEYELDKQKTLMNLMFASLTELYEDQSLFFDKETKDYIYKIIQIDHNPLHNTMVIRQQAKLRLVQIFEKWGFTIRLNNLQIMCNQWHQCLQEAQRQQKLGGLYSRTIMIEIIEEYWQYLDIHYIQQIYRCFAITSELKRHVETKTDQFYNYCSKLAQVLMSNNRLKQTAGIIKIVNERFQPNYQLMSQCMLKSLVQLYENDEKVAKRYIDYFIINWGSNPQLLDLKFQSGFQDNLESYEEQNFYVNTDLCFKNHRHKIQTDLIWDLVKESQILHSKADTSDISNSVDSERKKISNIYNNYFFFAMGLVNPNLGFSVLEFISYDYQSIFSLMKYVFEEFQIHKKFFFLDLTIVFKIYLNAITKLIVSRNENIKINDETSLASLAETLQNVREQIRKGRYKYDQLASSITKMANLVNEANRKKNIQFNKYNQQIKGKLNLSAAIKKVNTTVGGVVNQQETSQKIIKQVQDHNVTISFDEFKKMKKKLKDDKDLSMTMGIEGTERMIVSQILDNIGAIKGDITMINKPELPIIICESLQQIQNRSMDEKMLQTHKEVKTQKQFIQVLNSEDFTSLDYWSAGAVYVETQKVYDNEDIQFWKVIKMFHQLCVGNNNKIQVLWVSEPENLQLPNKVIKKIFSLEYLNVDFYPEWDNEEQQILSLLSQNINELTEQQIISLSSYLNDISKVEYKKVTRTDWQNKMVRLVIDNLSRRQDFEADQMLKMYNLVPLFSKEYIKKYENQIMSQIKVQSLKEAFRGSLDLAKKQRKIR